MRVDCTHCDDDKRKFLRFKLQIYSLDFLQRAFVGRTRRCGGHKRHVGRTTSLVSRRWRPAMRRRVVRVNVMWGRVWGVTHTERRVHWLWRHFRLKREWCRRADDRSRHFDRLWLLRHVGQQVDALGQRQVARLSGWMRNSHFPEFVARVGCRRRRGWRWRGRNRRVLRRDASVCHVGRRRVARVKIFRMSSHVNRGCDRRRWRRRRGSGRGRWSSLIGVSLRSAETEPWSSVIVDSAKLVGASDTCSSQSCRGAAEKIGSIFKILPANLKCVLKWLKTLIQKLETEVMARDYSSDE